MLRPLRDPFAFKRGVLCSSCCLEVLLLNAWLQTRQLEPDAQLLTFVTGRAVQNRARPHPVERGRSAGVWHGAQRFWVAV